MGTSRASKLRKSATARPSSPKSKSKSPPKAGAKARPGASEAKPIKVRKGEKAVLLSGGNPRIAKADGDGRERATAKPASRLIDQRIRDLGRGGDWREETLARMRALILEADPEMIEERKWRKPSNAMAGVPVWSHHGIVCTGEAYAKVVKLTFARGASLKDPAALFNSSLDGKVRRAIDIHEGDEIDESGFKDLIRAAVALNSSGKKK